MIHKLILLDRNKSIGVSLFDNNQIDIQSDLLLGLVQALMLLGEEMGPHKGLLREAELGKYQIGILSVDHLAYIVLQDAYDSEPFTRRMLQGVINKYHSVFKIANFNQSLENEHEIKENVFNLLQTMKFPLRLLPKIQKNIDSFITDTSDICDTLLLADLDDGIIKVFSENNNTENVTKILMEILSEIPFERHWLGESKLMKSKLINSRYRTHEAWFIYRIGLTDFCLLGRAFYNPDDERDFLVNNIEILSKKILEKLNSDDEFIKNNS